MNKTFSLSAFLKDLLALVDGAELSWDFKLEAYWGHPGYFMIFVPITLYGPRQKALQVQIKGVAEDHGLILSPLQFRTQGADFVLEGRFADIKADRL